jgi:hypothetical protein
MKHIRSINPKEILNLFQGWENELPYCTEGRPSYDSEVENKCKETIQIDFIWFNIPSKIVFKRLIGTSTNYYWGLREFGKNCDIIIGDVLINVDKFTENYTYQYGTKFVNQNTKQLEAPLKRVLKALKDGEIPSPVNELVYIDNKWLQIISIEDFKQSFIYCGK